MREKNNSHSKQRRTNIWIIGIPHTLCHRLLWRLTPEHKEQRKRTCEYHLCSHFITTTHAHTPHIQINYLHMDLKKLLLCMDKNENTNKLLKVFQNRSHILSFGWSPFNPVISVCVSSYNVVFMPLRSLVMNISLKSILASSPESPSEIGNIFGDNMSLWDTKMSNSQWWGGEERGGGRCYRSEAFTPVFLL